MALRWQQELPVEPAVGAWVAKAVTASLRVTDLDTRGGVCVYVRVL